MILEGNILKCAGDLKILNTLAHSGFSNVYLAEDINTKKRYALKAIKSPNNKYRIHNEINIYKIVNTFDYVLKLFKVFKDNKKLFFVYELSSDRDLDYIVQKEGELKESTILNVLKDVLTTLKQAHSKNIIHGDIKPDNILLHNNHYSLNDWGLSKQSEKKKVLNIQSDYLYTAPEFYNGYVYKSSDIYSLGATLYYLATKKVVYDLTYEDDFSYKMYAHCKLDIDVSLIKSEKLKYIIQKMTQKEYKQRINIQQLEALLLQKDVTYINEKRDIDYPKYKTKIDLELYEELSREDVTFAHNSLGSYYSTFSDNRSKEKTFKYYDKAASNGLIKGFYNLGICYKNGIGVKVNVSMALECLKKSAIQNHAKSIYMLAYFYENGIGIEKDLKKSLQLYYEAAFHGNKKAYEKINSYNFKPI